MIRKPLRTAALILLIAFLSWRVSNISAQPTITNLLQNPSFEENYDGYGPYQEIRTAEGWRAWWIEHEGDAGWILRRPECKPANDFIFANRVKSGEFAQQCFTFFGTHDMGLYQQVRVQPGQVLRFSIWTQVWSSTYSNGEISELPGNVRVSIGIDPTGGTDPLSPVIHWSSEIEAYDRWHFQLVEEVAQNTTITVFTRSRAEFAVKHNEVYWDEAGLLDADLALTLKLTPIPTATPKPTPTLGPGSILYAPPITDTLRVIAARFNLDLETLARSNRAPADLIVRPNFPIVVPGGTLRQIVHNTYIAQPGDTLQSVAAKFQYSPIELEQLNRRFAAGITWPGETLILP